MADENRYSMAVAFSHCLGASHAGVSLVSGTPRLFHHPLLHGLVIEDLSEQFS